MISTKHKHLGRIRDLSNELLREIVNYYEKYNKEFNRSNQKKMKKCQKTAEHLYFQLLAFAIQEDVTDSVLFNLKTDGIIELNSKSKENKIDQESDEFQETDE